MDLSLQTFSLQHIGAKDWLNVGAWSWSADKQTEKLPLKLYELRPPIISLKQVNFRPLARTSGTVARSLEVWWDGEEARLIYAANSPAALDPLRQAYQGLEAEEIKESEPPWVKELEKPPLFFDLEQLHGLAFCRFIEDHRGELMDHVLGSLEGCAPAWLQIVSVAFNYSPYSEAFANTLDQIIQGVHTGHGSAMFSTKGIEKVRFEPSPHETGSTIAKYGGLISKEAFEKGQLANAIVHIRGLVSDPSTADALSHALTAGVKISYDYAAALPYDDPRLLRFLRTRNLPDPSWPLANLAEGGFTGKWSNEPKRGRRTLVPVFCAVLPELAVFNCLPTDPSLPVSYARPKRRQKRRVRE